MQTGRLAQAIAPLELHSSAFPRGYFLWKGDSAEHTVCPCTQNAISVLEHLNLWDFFFMMACKPHCPALAAHSRWGSHCLKPQKPDLLEKVCQDFSHV